MRAKLVLFFTLLFCMSAISFCQTETRLVDFLFSAGSKEVILDWGQRQAVWGKHHGGSCRVLEYSEGSNQALLLLQDIGSGLCLENIYLFGKSKETKEWHFVLYRPTGVEVVAKKKGDKLIFSTITDDVILEQSLLSFGHFCQSNIKHAEFPEDDKSQESILAWGKQNDCRVFEYSLDDNHAIVLLKNISTEERRDAIYIYGKPKETGACWFVLYRPTDTTIKVEQREDILVFTTETGDIILEQPLNALGTFQGIVTTKR